MPKVSIIIPVYNGEKYLKKTLISVFRQDFRDFEVILIDDGSTDKTSEISQQFKDKKLRYYWQENSGCPAAARNAGLKKARGKYIAFLDQDDLWNFNKLTQQVEILDKNPKIGAVFTNCWIMDERSQNLYRVWSNITRKRGLSQKTSPKLLAGNFILTASCAMVRKKIIDKIGAFDESLKLADEYDLWFRLAREAEIYLIGRPLTKWRLTKESLSHDNEKLLKDLIYFYQKSLKIQLNPEEKNIAQNNLSNFQLRLINFYLKNGRYKKAQRQIRKICPKNSEQKINCWLGENFPLFLGKVLKIKDYFYKSRTIRQIEVAI